MRLEAKPGSWKRTFVYAFSSFSRSEKTTVAYSGSRKNRAATMNTIHENRRVPSPPRGRDPPPPFPSRSQDRITPRGPNGGLVDVIGATAQPGAGELNSR